MSETIHVAIKSFGRAGGVSTLRVVPFAKVWVPESQAADYEAAYGADSLVVIPDAADGNLERKHNAILDRTPCRWTLILDDDITGIGMWERGRHRWLGPEKVRSMIEHHFSIADQLGVKLWGINQNRDPTSYDVYRPFSLLAPILGPFMGHLEPELRFDESVLGKDDYDFWLQNIRRHRFTLRANKYHYVHDHGQRPGGFVSMRTDEVERAGVLRMQEKWGRKVFKAGGTAGRTASGTNILNSWVRVPIQGC